MLKVNTTAVIWYLYKSLFKKAKKVKGQKSSYPSLLSIINSPSIPKAFGTNSQTFKLSIPKAFGTNSQSRKLSGQILKSSNSQSRKLSGQTLKSSNSQIFKFSELSELRTQNYLLLRHCHYIVHGHGDRHSFGHLRILFYLCISQKDVSFTANGQCSIQIKCIALTHKLYIFCKINRTILVH